MKNFSNVSVKIIDILGSKYEGNYYARLILYKKYAILILTIGHSLLHLEIKGEYIEKVSDNK